MLDLELPHIAKKTTRGNLGCYEIGPVEASISTALASALRRTLLTSLEGAAITSLLIEGVLHELQDIPNVKEDVTDLVQNIKKVRLRSYVDHPVTVHLEAKGEGVVTAGALQTPSTIEIVNPDLYLATLDNECAELSMELVVGTGRGFVSCETQAEQRAERPPRGVILVDAIYSPIVKAHFTIEELYRGRTQDLDTIILEISTDGTISPDEALRQSAGILLQQFAHIANSRYEREIPGKPSHLSDIFIPSSIYDRPIEDLHMSRAATNALGRAGITKVGQVLTMSEEELSFIRHFGEKSLQELASRLKSLGFLSTDEKSGR